MVNNSNDIFRLNVGFIIHQNVGFQREFPIDDSSAFLKPDLYLYNITGVARVTRASQGLLIQVSMIAEIPAECVRCLAEFMQKLEISFTELYAFTQNSVTESGLLVPENGKIDLGPLVREWMLLSVPIGPLCRSDCKGLCAICGENLNDVKCYHEEEYIDPRIAPLGALLDNNLEEA